MKNFVQEGKTVTVTAPAALASGVGVLIGSMFGVTNSAAANGAEVEIDLCGVFDLVRATGASTDWTPGTLLYWDDTNKRITKTSSGNTKIGVAVTAALVGDATGRVRLNGTF